MSDVSEYVVLFHGDLVTGERIKAAQQHCSIEGSPWNRMQHVIFVPGLFHLKMACADAIWQIFIQPSAAREDVMSLMQDVGILRPREIGIYTSKPGFQRMHQLIGYDGTCRHLDCWRVEVQVRNREHTSLDIFALSEPSFEDLQEIADNISRKYIGNYQLRQMWNKSASQRDQQYENSLLLNKYFMLYEELSYAMNHGDIGRVESCIITWILIFKATGKHKYATQMMDFLCSVHFNYPEGLWYVLKGNAKLGTNII
ncbi:hypothetical protein PAXRUDRAFT_179058 [Paxillus rubicundulus Ve08.2h10]|uniref:DUF6589 domain-containing protein n=1 Tax=Paxillus rubicundulus Ve08.2h10 TaxID=930991 RepID=A0A0D0CQU0_9AGAM|nr:hypothetical protein PAXRUDRAFT_179058 [Paxillus rubicundulus Ve08.2h10]